MDDDRLAATLMQDEGFRGVPYVDTEGKLTIGYGRNLIDNPLQPHEAAELLMSDITRTVRDLDRMLPWWRSLSEARQMVLANMAYNLGLPRLLGFQKFLAAAKRGDYDLAAHEMLDSLWHKQVGKRAERLAEEMRHG